MPYAVQWFPANPVQTKKDHNSGSPPPPRSPDFAELDRRIAGLLEAAPNARFLLEVSVDAPAWWQEKHPEECAVGCLPESGEATKRRLTAASWASRLWQQEAGEALIRLVRHVG